MKRGGYWKNERNLEGDKSIMDSIDEPYTNYNYDNESIITYNIEDIRYEMYVHLNINAGLD